MKKKDQPIFSEETLASLIELGEVLRPIYERMITEGYVFKDGKATKLEK